VLLALLGCHAPPPDHDVLLVSIDGAAYALLEEEWDGLVTLPALGALQPLAVEGVTDTMASHARLLTGYGPEVTGVEAAWAWTPVPEGLSLPERLKARFGPALDRLWVVNKPHMLGVGEADPFHAAGDACDVTVVKQMKVDVTPDMIAALDGVGDRPFFAFFHWGQVDNIGHQHGERSEEQRAALRDVDARLGEVLDHLETLGRRDRARVYVTTDHGFDPGGDSHYVDAADVFLVTDDPGVGPGTWIHQLPWTILRDYGVTEDPYPAPVEGL